MGLFNYVNYSANCRHCKTEVTEWQTKDGDSRMVTVSPTTVDSFYTICPGCGGWLDAVVEKEVTVTGIKVSFLPKAEFTPKWSTKCGTTE
jgi:Zn finger protein HypA/HybF involved in hydrogenase expression